MQVAEAEQFKMVVLLAQAVLVAVETLAQTEQLTQAVVVDQELLAALE
jgi:hypothetical protein